MRTVLITGGASGIGLACAEAFAAAGERVIVVDRSLGSDVAQRFGGFEADVRDRARADAIVATLERVDVLVTCAGISRDRALHKMDDVTWRDVIDVDLTGTFNYLAACSSRFREQQSGKVVLVASTLALRARRGVANYVAAKAGVAALAHAAARDLGYFNVNVNCVAPGLVRTPLTAAIPEETQHRLEEETCLGRLGEPGDIAGVVLFLCSDASRHITGEVIRVDGGQLA